MRSLEVAQAAVLHERDAASRQLELEQVGVVAGAKQDRLRAQLHPLLARGEHAIAHLPRLLALVARKHELGRLPPSRSVHSRFGNPRRSCSETALATARIGAVER